MLLLKRSDGGIETLLLNRLIASVGADDHNSVFLISGGLTNKERRRVTGKERSDLAAAIEELVNNLPYDDLITKTVAEIVSALLRY